MIDITFDSRERVKYDYPDFPVYIRRDFLSVFPDFRAESHWHDDIELLVVTQGEIDYNINGEVIHLLQGEGVLVNSRQFHFGFSDERQNCEYICFLFHPMILCTNKMFEENYVSPVLNSGIPFVHLKKSVEWQNTILDCVIGVCDCRFSSSAPLYVRGAVNILWQKLCENIETKGVGNDTKLTTLKMMISFIHDHFNEKITLDDIAQAGHISKRSCGNLFLKYANKTPVEFLIDHRLRKSIELLKNENMTVLEVALAVGFSGASYYSETFKKHFDKTPLEYRKGL